jgi:Transglycosylase-like domain
MPEASRHAKPKPAATRIRASMLATATLAGVAAAFVVLHGGSAPPKPARYATPVTSAAAAFTDDDLQNAAAIRHEIAILQARIVMRTRAAARRVHHAAAAARHTQQAAQQAPQTTRQPAPAASPTPTPAPVAHTGGDAASSPLGICIRRAEEGGSYAWGPGNGGGAYQFLLGTWEKYGGAASEYGVAGPAYQDRIFDNAIAAGGASNWTAYDGC